MNGLRDLNPAIKMNRNQPETATFAQTPAVFYGKFYPRPLLTASKFEILARYRSELFDLFSFQPENEMKFVKYTDNWSFTFPLN